MKKRRHRNTKPYFLYALELEDGYWYVGMTIDVDKRFTQHMEGKGAKWTALHKPLRIYEIRATNIINPKTASRHEDMMALDYALQYGEANVRGGQWSRVLSPGWPKER